jgi:hypothetical protein
MEEKSWTGHVKNEVFIESRKKGTSYVQQDVMAKWVGGHFLRKYCLLTSVIEGNIEGRRRRGRRRKQPLEGIKDKR